MNSAELIDAPLFVKPISIIGCSKEAAPNQVPGVAARSNY